MTNAKAKPAGRRAGRVGAKAQSANKPIAAQRPVRAATAASAKTNGIIWPGRNDPRVLAQIAALRGLSTDKLRERWTELFDIPPPPVGRGYLEGRLTYRIQELAYGGLRKETLDRLRALAKQYDMPGSIVERRRQRAPEPLAVRPPLA